MNNLTRQQKQQNTTDGSCICASEIVRFTYCVMVSYAPPMNRENNKRLKKCLTIDICYYPEEKKQTLRMR
jgi:hypothetical protein